MLAGQTWAAQFCKADPLAFVQPRSWRITTSPWAQRLLRVARDRRGLRIPGIEPLARWQAGRLAVDLAGRAVLTGGLFGEQDLEHLGEVPTLLTRPGEDCWPASRK